MTSLGRIGAVSGIVCRGTWDGSVTRNGRGYSAVLYGSSGVDNDSTVRCGSILDR